MAHRLHLAAAAAALSLALATAVLAQAPGDGLPDGPGKDVLLRACTACHEVSTVIGQPRTPEGWEAMIGSMINNGAELTGDEQAALQAYLVKNYGVKPPPEAPKPPTAR
jgi:competence protein ComEA